jgi:hypothetical protein
MNFGYLAQTPPTPAYPQQTAATTKTVPFDYVVTLKFKNQPGRVAQNVINVSVEGYFVATAIGYSLLIDERQSFGAAPPGDPDSFDIPISPSAIPRFTAPDNIKIFGEPDAEVRVFKEGSLLSTLKLDENGRKVESFVEFANGDIVTISDVTNKLKSREITIRQISADPLPITFIRPQFGPQ